MFVFLCGRVFVGKIRVWCEMCCLFDRGCGEGYLIIRLICDLSGVNYLKVILMFGFVLGFVYLVMFFFFILIIDRIVGSEIFVVMFWEWKELWFVLLCRNYLKSLCYCVGISVVICVFGYGLFVFNLCF